MLLPKNIQIDIEKMTDLPLQETKDTVIFFVEEGDDSFKNLQHFLNIRMDDTFIKGLQKKRFQKEIFFRQQENNVQKIIVINLGHVQKYQSDDWLKCGGAVMATLFHEKQAKLYFSLQNLPVTKEILGEFLEGLFLRCYKFQKYFYKKVKQDAFQLEKLNLCLKTDLTHAECEQILEQKFFVAQAVCAARDLVNEPSNVLTPDCFGKKIKDLEKLGLTVTLLEEEALEKLGMYALLGVGRGSNQSTKLAIIEWEGQDKSSLPLAFVGKGITFDSGGISIKPSLNMEDMKGDMGGAAAVFGLMQLVAQRKSSAHIIGVIALAENMPSGTAQKPGDIVTSLSKQTIEINNTDAEGRLVLADALAYTIQIYKPRLIVNLATLTGAIIIALGSEYAGLFSNDTMLAQQLRQAGEETGEKLWQLPLNKAYDKSIDSKFADMKNSAGRAASSITAAQFLKRFVEDTAWAHLDIAGTASDVPSHEYNQSWGTGFGVRLLNRFIENNFEK